MPPVGLYPQPKDWMCGPFALKHALITLGRLVEEDNIARIARTHWWSGTDEIRLARAARAFDCDLAYERTRDPDRARSLLIHHLRRKVPVLLCVDDWGHWITAVRYESHQFVVIDSDEDPVLHASTWSKLKSRWRYLDWDYDEENPPELYDLFAVEPGFKVQVKADFSLARLRFLRRAENYRLSLHWDEYLEDLLEICRPPSVRLVEKLSMGEFLRRNQDLIIARVLFWHGEIERDVVVRLLRNFRFVAETYGLVIPAASTRRALADVAILITMCVISMHGIGELYGLTS
jgi:hypothetical protein